ncbi:hypothetical protein VNO77_03785 [Canavalia gladiata]|uniref:Uncharacterized protein n=1 Tax=Canavalia gladiata TaxID=3824 RepID=A0AAN9MVH1_CANGL
MITDASFIRIPCMFMWGLHGASTKVNANHPFERTSRSHAKSELNGPIKKNRSLELQSKLMNVQQLSFDRNSPQSVRVMKSPRNPVERKSERKILKNESQAPPARLEENTIIDGCIPSPPTLKRENGNVGLRIMKFPLLELIEDNRLKWFLSKLPWKRFGFLCIVDRNVVGNYGIENETLKRRRIFWILATALEDSWGLLLAFSSTLIRLLKTSSSDGHNSFTLMATSRVTSTVIDAASVVEVSKSSIFNNAEKENVGGKEIEYSRDIEDYFIIDTQSLAQFRKILHSRESAALFVNCEDAKAACCPENGPSFLWPFFLSAYYWSSSRYNGCKLRRKHLFCDYICLQVLKSYEKQIAYHTCVALWQYFKAHLLVLTDSICPSKSNCRVARNIPSIGAVMGRIP